MKVDQVFERLISVDHLGAAEQFYYEILGWDMIRKHVGTTWQLIALLTQITLTLQKLETLTAR